MHAEQERLGGLLAAQRRVLHEEEWNDRQAPAVAEHESRLSLRAAGVGGQQLADRRARRARQLPIIFDSKSHPRDHDALMLLYQRDHSRRALAEHHRIVDALTLREVGTRRGTHAREHILTNRDVLIRALGDEQPGAAAAQRCPGSGGQLAPPTRAAAFPPARARAWRAGAGCDFDRNGGVGEEIWGGPGSSVVSFFEPPKAHGCARRLRRNGSAL
ncbi:hypothetical protein ACU4GD_31465 [Cupriavidus basilensis]